jgi:hypothetical protein
MPLEKRWKQEKVAPDQGTFLVESAASHALIPSRAHLVGRPASRLTRKEVQRAYHHSTSSRFA